MINKLVFIVVSADDDPYSGMHFEAAFLTRKKAESYIKHLFIENDGRDGGWYIIEAEIN